jgi:cellulose synthase/poly-beta-1,6-N-acetylglucosamine synthase-like glycosyltransferase
LLTLAFATEILAGLKPLQKRNADQSAAVSATIVVPAHNEQPILRTRLSELKAAAGDDARILLVADNCQDSTAEIGRDVGVEVIERDDPARKGKGYALDFARKYLRANPPEVVLVVDADCTMDNGSVRSLAAHCALSERPCQAMNIQLPAANSSPLVRLSTFAFFVKNVIRQRGLQRLIGHGQLLGTGMAFPWEIFARADLATGDLVEDLKLGQELRVQGHGALFVEAACVVSEAETGRNTLSQRRRWEGGFLANAFREGPSFLLGSIRRADWSGSWAAVNLMIPPVALLVLLDFLGLAVAGAITWLVGASSWPVMLLAGALMIALIAIGLAWHAGGSRFVGAAELAKAPLYVLWKIPMYLGFAAAGAPEEWNRTDRGESGARH